MKKRKSPRKPPHMSLRQFGDLKSVSRQAVLAAINRGDIPVAATCWTKEGKRRVLKIVDVPLAAKSFTPPVEHPLPAPGGEPSALTEASSMADANRLHAIARARKAQLDFDLAAKRVVSVDVLRLEVSACVVFARTAFLNVGWKAAAKAGLTREQACDVNDCAREILDNLVESNARVIAKATDKKLSDVASDLERMVGEAEKGNDHVTQ